MVKITGQGNVRRRLDGVSGPAAVKEIGAALYAGGSLIQTSAQHSITSGSISGKGHIASLPGEPPNADTHALDRQIETVQISPLRVEVQSNDPKSAWLEYGTSRMEARPFMLPALKMNYDAVLKLVRGAANRVITRSRQ
jgi:hypothetical protein